MRTSRIVGCALAAAAIASGAAAASAPAAITVRFKRLEGVSAPGTPKRLDRVGVLMTGSAHARNVLVLNPGTSAGSAYFEPLARDIVARAPGWQVWSVERRENQLEDQSMLDRAKRGQATTQQVFDYYLGWLTNHAITTHFQPIPDASVGFARDWGMNVEIGDLRRVVLAAKRPGGKVVLGGHSLGGSITTAYATWSFHGTPGAKGLAGLVYIDGGSSPQPVTADQARTSLTSLRTSTPWLAFGGLLTPFAGLFSTTGGLGALLDPNSPSVGQAFALLPANLKPPVRATNLAQFGYALDTKTSPPALAAAQAHLGQLATGRDPRGWNSVGALTPIRRLATMFSGFGERGVDGVAWYHPLRLTIDAGAVADGNANPAQRVLDVHATQGRRLPRGLRIYAFAAALGGTRVLDAAKTLARQSHIPRRNLVLVDRHATYAHNDPAGARPAGNAFLARLVPFLRGIAARRR